MKKITTALLFVLLSASSTFAQGDIDMATGLRSSGKIYVVVLVLLTIFAILGAFLFTIERRVKKLEK
ncbi:CcmD family protein [Sphingobacterium shayense]|uniref:CcmD family protein n=1 Tax=Sphingobacterium shayense TaxID=626343 RepID=UPI0015548470|nr:CcmD family protein [Sphingobacterium shayense]NQD69709.1 CcmD family protein [Sphingobacterium shayense]